MKPNKPTKLIMDDAGIIDTSPQWTKPTTNQTTEELRKEFDKLARKEWGRNNLW